MFSRCIFHLLKFSKLFMEKQSQSNFKLLAQKLHSTSSPTAQKLLSITLVIKLFQLEQNTFISHTERLKYLALDLTTKNINILLFHPEESQNC